MAGAAHKPIRRGKGSYVRFDNKELSVLLAALDGREGELDGKLRSRLLAAREEADLEARTWADSDRLEHPLSEGRAAMTGWTRVTEPNSTVELHMRRGDFLPDEQGEAAGWRYGTRGAFRGRDGIVEDAWQACLFSRDGGRWAMVGGKPGSFEERRAAGQAMIERCRAGIPGDIATAVGTGYSRSHAKPALEHSYASMSDHHSGAFHGGDVQALGRIEGRFPTDIQLVRGTAIVQIVTGYMKTVFNDQWHPTYDIPTVVRADKYDHATRTGPFWCEIGEAWSLRLLGNPPLTVLTGGRWKGRVDRSEANFPVFATMEEAIAYAASIPGAVLDVAVPDVTPEALSIPTDNANGFAWAA